MRTSLFLSTLFAVSMVGGAALAEKPAAGTSGGKEPQVVERLRAHGDTVDKVYRAPVERASRGASGPSSQVREVRAPAPSAKNPTDRANSRINCADTDPNCAAMHSSSHAVNTGGAEKGNGGYNVRPPAFLDKVLGSDRTNFNEAGEDQGMSARAANRVWARAGHSTSGGSHASEASATLAQKTQVDRKSGQYQSSRVSCNEAEDCEASSKDVKKEWAYQAIKAGTWTGPEKREPTAAARRIAADRAAESASLHDEKVAHETAEHMRGGHSGGGAAGGGGDQH